MHRAFIGIGSNLNDPVQQVHDALYALRHTPEVSLIQHSALYLTPPFGGLEQPDFVNTVAEIETHWNPYMLLAFLQKIEADQERVRDKRWGPRTIDLDLLLFDNTVLTDPKLTIPHPGLTQRAFVACLIEEIAPHLTLPDGTAIRDVTKHLDSSTLMPLTEEVV